ncbi:hypothetical protein ACIGHB_06440 [Streptomyces sp. NPDC085460]|uniref:hypothetical protein n=1 Tax=Streptomyces sp. NPDC085460 TaxID=3365723 RepID=UPI0037D2B9C4
MTGRLAFVESPVQLLNVLEWAHARGRGTTPAAAAPATAPADPGADGAPAPVTAEPEGSAADDLRIVVLSPTDPMSRGQLRRMAQLARDEGFAVHWQEARAGRGALVRTLRELGGPLRAAGRVIVGDPFSRYVQLLLTLFGPRHVTVVDDGTATMEYAAQLAGGERLVRWHRKGDLGPRELALAPVTSLARRRLAPGPGRSVEIFTSLPVQAPPGTEVTENAYAWTRERFGPPALTGGADLVGTSLVETGVVDAEHYLRVVGQLARTHGATRYFAHRRETPEKLHRVAVETGLQVVRPDLPLELIARRGPIGATIVSFPSTVVHTLPLALAGTGVKVAVCEIAPEWLRATASPRAQGFLAGVAGTAAGVDRLTPRTGSAVDRLEFG